MDLRRFWLVLAMVAVVVVVVLILLGVIPAISRLLFVATVAAAIIAAAVVEAVRARSAWVNQSGVATGRRVAIRRSVVAAAAALIGVPLLLLSLASYTQTHHL